MAFSTAYRKSVSSYKKLIKTIMQAIQQAEEAIKYMSDSELKIRLENSTLDNEKGIVISNCAWQKDLIVKEIKNRKRKNRKILLNQAVLNQVTKGNILVLDKYR